MSDQPNLRVIPQEERPLFKSFGVEPDKVGQLICEQLDDNYAIENMFPLSDGKVCLLFVDAPAKQAAFMKQQYELAKAQQQEQANKKGV